MKNYLTIILAATLFFFISCKKDKVIETSQPETTYPDFAKLKTGNYWVYELFDIDTSGNATSENKFDSCYIEKDTLINNVSYFKFIKKTSIAIQKPTIFVRDSLHYVVDNYGKILFSSQDFSTIFHSGYQVLPPSDTICKITDKMDEKNAVVSTPYGSFSTYDYKETFALYPTHIGLRDILYSHTRYAENVGIVVETVAVFASGTLSIERRLVRYHVD